MMIWYTFEFTDNHGVRQSFRELLHYPEIAGEDYAVMQRIRDKNGYNVFTCAPTWRYDRGIPPFHP
jgi:hypothetical protein